MAKGVDWTLFRESDGQAIDDLYAIYKQSPSEAKIVYEMNKANYSRRRVVLFNHGKDFQIAIMRKKYGISSNNRIYHSEVCEGSLSYSKGKFYQTKRSGTKKHVQQLTWFGLMEFIQSFKDVAEYERDTEAYKWMIEKFSWIRFLGENTLLMAMPFNMVVTHKLYNMNDALRHLFKAPLPVIKILMLVYNDYERPKLFKLWKEMRKILYNVENMRYEMVKDELFIDTCKMANMLGKRVNCSWSMKRLKLEHDRWSKEVTKAILKHEKLRELNVAKVYRDFAIYSGYRLLITNHELIAEGILQNHCVATYIGSVDAGHSGIYHIDGYTLELKFGQKSSWLKDGDTKIWINQFRGQSNKSAPTELHSKVVDNLIVFNESIGVYEDSLLALVDGNPF